MPFGRMPVRKCMAKNGSGGGPHRGSDITINKSAFVVSSGNNGGGVYATSSKNRMMDSVFRICMSKRGGESPHRFRFADQRLPV